MNTQFSSIYVNEYEINRLTPASESLGLLAHCENPIDVSTPAILTSEIHSKLLFNNVEILAYIDL